MSRPASFAARTFAIPLALVGCTVFGLVSALLGDGVWDALSWFALAAPLVLALYHLRRARPTV